MAEEIDAALQNKKEYKMLKSKKETKREIKMKSLVEM